MRRTIDVLGLVVLGLLYWITYAALNGNQQLKGPVPTHFDFSGQPNGWGPPSILWLLPLIGTGLYLLLMVIGSIRFRSFNLPVRPTPASLPFIQEQTSLLVAWIRLELAALFLYLQWSIIEGARSARFRISPVFLPVFLGIVFCTLGLQISRIVRGARDRNNQAPQSSL